MSLRRMRWMSDEDGRWELDAETPVTMEGTVRPVPGDPLPLGLSRGYRVTRPQAARLLPPLHGVPSGPHLLRQPRRPLRQPRPHPLHHGQLLPHHNITLQASWPGLFVDKKGAYWDVPLSLSADLASVGSSSGLSYHLLLLQNSGEPKCFGGDETDDVPIALLPGLCAKAAISIKKSIDAWRKKEDKLKNIQPYDIFLSDSHVSLTGIVGAVASGYLGNCSRRVAIRDETQKSNAFRMFDERNKCAAFADLFASVTFTAQYGNFQRLFLDLTRASARFDITSGSLFLCGASRLAQDFFFSRRPDVETFCDICPDVTVSLQQQIVGPFSFRVESSVAIDPRSQDHFVRVDDPIFAIDWALKVLGSAKATAWYSPKHQEAMVELRFYEA